MNKKHRQSDCWLKVRVEFGFHLPGRVIAKILKIFRLWTA